MKTLLFTLALLVAAPLAADEPKKPVVKSLPPQAVDPAFDKATSDKALVESLLNDPVYKAAIAAAVKAFKEQAAEIAKHKKWAGPSPAQSAREAFIEALTAPPVGEAPKK